MLYRNRLTTNQLKNGYQTTSDYRVFNAGNRLPKASATVAFKKSATQKPAQFKMPPYK